MGTQKICIECKDAQKRPHHPKWCEECWLRHRPMVERCSEASKRAARVPDGERRTTVPRSEWPPNRRWCAGCQSFVSLLDVASGASRCRPCVSNDRHGAMVEEKYGIDESTYQALLRSQDGRCWICQTHPRGIRLAVDHDHRTGRVRGLLCKRCNHDLLGAAHDGTALLYRAIAYLEATPFDALCDTLLDD